MTRKSQARAGSRMVALCVVSVTVVICVNLGAQAPARPEAPATRPVTVTPQTKTAAGGQGTSVTTSHQPGNAIRTLAVRVVTGAAGSCDQVWFSIGPLGWKLENAHRNSGDSHAGCGQLSVHCAEESAKHAEHEAERQAKGLCLFTAGADDTYELPIPAGMNPPYLTTDDITLVALQKKGMGGLYNAPDSPPGDWGPHKVTLLVNGAPFPDASCCLVNERLHHGNATWVQTLKPYPLNAANRDEEIFARSLRLIPNAALNSMSEDVALLTTKFGKDRGISGWLAQPIGPTCATGRVIRTPAVSTDGLATIDLGVDKIEITKTLPPARGAQIPALALSRGEPEPTGSATPAQGAKTETLEYVLDGKHGIAGSRYLRVEYAFHGNALPRNQDQVRICGEVYRDTDYESWFEIHPRDAADVAVFSPTPVPQGNPAAGQKAATLGKQPR
jgi:hypothetical protein